MNSLTKRKVADALLRIADRVEGLGLLFDNPEKLNHCRFMRNDLKELAAVFHKEANNGKKVPRKKRKKGKRRRPKGS